MEYLVTILVNGQPMEVTIRLGEDTTVPSDAENEKIVEGEMVEE